MGREYAASGDMSESDAVWADWKNDHNSWDDLAYNAIPGYGMYRAFGGRKAWKKKRGALEAQQDAADSAARWQSMRGYAGRLDAMTATADANRAKALAALGLAYGDGTREAARESTYRTELADALAQLEQQHRTGLRSNGIALARRGLRGGSVDAERQGALALGYETGAQSAVEQGADRLRAGRRADASQLSTLRRAYLVDDPQKAAEMAALAASNAAGAERAGMGVRFGDARTGIRTQLADNLSRAYGGAARTAAASYSFY